MVLIENLKWFKLPLEKIRNGFEVNEKNGKENLEIKEFKKVVKFIFENLPKFLIKLKSIFKTLFEFDVDHICIWIEKGK